MRQACKAIAITSTLTCAFASFITGGVDSTITFHFVVCMLLFGIVAGLVGLLS